MKLFTIEVPIAGKVTVEVEAENEKEAIDKALDVDVDIKNGEWDVFRNIARGNVLYAPLNEPRIIDVEEQEEAVSDNEQTI